MYPALCARLAEVLREKLSGVVVIQTSVAGVELRQLGAEDAATHHALVQANRAHLLRLNDDYLFEVSSTVDDFASRFEDPANKSILLGIFGDGRLVGHIGLVYGEPPRWGLGYWLAEEALGQGIATAAVEALIAFARDHLAAEEVLGGVSHGNEKSVAVLQRCGFAPIADFDTYTRFGRRLV